MLLYALLTLVVILLALNLFALLSRRKERQELRELQAIRDRIAVRLREVEARLRQPVGTTPPAGWEAAGQWRGQFASRSQEKRVRLLKGEHPLHEESLPYAPYLQEPYTPPFALGDPLPVAPDTPSHAPLFGGGDSGGGGGGSAWEAPSAPSCEPSPSVEASSSYDSGSSGDSGSCDAGGGGGSD